MVNRRHFFQRGAQGVGAAALASLLSRDGFSASPMNAAGVGSSSGDAPQPNRGGIAAGPHFAPKAKRVIYLFQNGAPTHVDLFDYKPRLHKLHGMVLPDGYLEGKRFSSMTGNPQGKLMLQPVEPFKQHGKGGARGLCEGWKAGRGDGGQCDPGLFQQHHTVHRAQPAAGAEGGAAVSVEGADAIYQRAAARLEGVGKAGHQGHPRAQWLSHHHRARHADGDRWLQERADAG